MSDAVSSKYLCGVRMKSVLHPWQMLHPILAGWINQQQQNAIECLIAENRILREKIGKKRILLTDDQRRRLAVKGQVLGGTLAEICSIAMPETILRWYRELIAKKWDYSKCRKKVGLLASIASICDSAFWDKYRSFGGCQTIRLVHAC
jgi:hypothetical protein